MNSKTRKTIGILGGMGPQAGADLFLRIVRNFQCKAGAKFDSDFPQIILNSINPVMPWQSSYRPGLHRRSTCIRLSNA